jgi:hypothetical protein
VKNIGHQLAGLIVAGSFLLLLGNHSQVDANTKPHAERGEHICTQIAASIRDDERNGVEWQHEGIDVVLLHMAGCKVDHGTAIYAGDGISGHGCNHRAYAIAAWLTSQGINLATDDGYGFSVVYQVVTADGNCVETEDGTYIRR